MMSIRLRLTLLYCIILALTLVIFGLALYTIQANYTLNSLKQDLRLSGSRLVEATLRTVPNRLPPDLQFPPPPKPFDQFSDDQAFQRLPEREIARILDSNGVLVASPFGSSEDALPLSEEGVLALQNKQEWWQIEHVEDQRMLIYSRPVVKDGELINIVQTARTLTEYDRSLKSLAITLGIIGLITTVVAFGIGWTLSGITLKPIQRITQTAQTIGDERDFTRRVDYAGPADEVGLLANTFNAMLTQLEDAFKKVEHSLEMQRNFVADVSHELRTPLTTLRGNIELLRHTPPLPEDEQEDVFNDMAYESDRLIRLVNNLLVLARADAGRHLENEPLEISPILHEACHQASQLDPLRDIHLEADNGIFIRGDRDAFKQVMLILLDNALKHSEGAISVTANKQGAEILVRVKDQGPGIPPEKLKHLFDRFYRGDENCSAPGFGLGLSIAKALVENQSGTISIDSELQKGSTITLTFPAFGHLHVQDRAHPVR